MGSRPSKVWCEVNFGFRKLPPIEYTVFHLFFMNFIVRTRFDIVSIPLLTAMWSREVIMVWHTLFSIIFHFSVVIESWGNFYLQIKFPTCYSGYTTLQYLKLSSQSSMRRD